MPDGSIVFVDSNILLYAASGRPSDAQKAGRARALITSERISLSFQVLQEFYANAINPHKLGLSRAEAIAWCNAWMCHPVASLGPATFVRTLELAERYQISNWDAAILAAAQELGCSKVYSEDLGHGQNYGGILVENPLRGL